jgi:hypothetical protein
MTVESFDEYLERHRVDPPPEFGPYPRLPNLTEPEAAAWWNSRTPRERYSAGGWSFDPLESVDVIFSKKWEEWSESDRAAFLNMMRKGWMRVK